LNVSSAGADGVGVVAPGVVGVVGAADGAQPTASRLTIAAAANSRGSLLPFTVHLLRVLGKRLQTSRGASAGDGTRGADKRQCLRLHVITVFALNSTSGALG